MDAYMIIEAEIHDPVQFAEYTQALPPIVSRHGGEYRAVGGTHVPLEGDWTGKRLVISVWPSLEAAQAFWYSDEYQAIIPLREGTGDFRVILVEKLPTDPPAQAPARDEEEAVESIVEEASK